MDTSVSADILTKDPDWFEWSSAQIERWADQGPVCFNAIIFAELAVKFDSQKELENRLSAFTHMPMPLNAAFQAGKAFEKYRRAGGKKARPLPDFFIGAHAYVAHLQLLTRDPRRVRSFFPFRAAHHAVKPGVTARRRRRSANGRNVLARASFDPMNRLQPRRHFKIAR